MPLDRVGDDILVDFGGDDLLVGLVDLDDLLDLPIDVVCEKGWRSCPLHVILQKIFGPIVVLGFEHAHEAKSGCAVEIAGIEEDRRHKYAALELFQQREGAVDGEQRAGSVDEDDVGARVGVGRASAPPPDRPAARIPPERW